MRLGFFRLEETALFARITDWDFTGLEILKIKAGRAAGTTLQSRVGQGTSAYWALRTDVSGTAGIRVRMTDVGVYGSEWVSTGSGYRPTTAIICTGTPLGAIAAPVGSLAVRTDGGTGTTLYVKETGTTTSSGWVAK